MDNTIFCLAIKRTILRHIFEIFPDVTVEQQIHIVHRSIVYQPVPLACFVHIPGNLIFNLRTVDRDHAAVCILDLHTGSVDIELSGNNFLFHNSVLLNLFLFSLASRLRFWSFDNTVSEMCVLDFAEENN